jgi:methyl-accepting chemotaxis protein
VVAEEVRSLALRSKSAASRTEQLIRESVRQAGAGARASQAVGTQLSEIAGAVAEVAEIVSRIAGDTRQQAGSFGELSRAVDEVERVTRANAEVSEASARTGQQLAARAVELETLVGGFRLREAEPGRPGAARRAPEAAPRPLARA